MVDSKLKGLVLGSVVAIALGLLWAWIGWPSRDSSTPNEAYLKGELSRTLELLAAQAASRPLPDAQHVLLQANSLRQLGRNDEFHQLLKLSSIHKELTATVQLAQALFNVQHASSSNFDRAAAGQLVTTLQAGGALQSDAYSVVIQGLLQLNDLKQAQELLERWQQLVGTNAQLEYLWAVYFNVCGQPEETEKRLVDTIERYPHHELSWLALAELLARPPNVRLEASRYVLERMLLRFPEEPQRSLRLSQLQRRLGRPNQVLSISDRSTTTDQSVELALVALDRGQFDQALEHWRAAGWSTPEAFQYVVDQSFQLTINGRSAAAETWNQRISRGATALALNGETLQAQRIFDHAANRTARLRRLQDLAVEQAYRSHDPSLAIEAQQVADLSADVLPTLPVTQLTPGAHSDDRRGWELYRQHCAHCHGVSGNGRGVASPNLSPPARNFREEPMRLISTASGRPNLDDLMRTIRLGEPGTSMPGFAKLSDDEIRSLANIVAQFLPPERAVTDEPSIKIPQLQQTPEQVERGRVVFQRAGCNGCHRAHESGKPTGGATVQLFDGLGRPIRAPHLARDQFHGGSRPEDIYKRIVLGIPGTPHPQLLAVQPDEQAALVAYLLAQRRP